MIKLEVGDLIETQTPDGHVIDCGVWVIEVDSDAAIEGNFIGIDDEDVECLFSNTMVSKVFRANHTGTFFLIWEK